MSIEKTRGALLSSSVPLDDAMSRSGLRVWQERRRCRYTIPTRIRYVQYQGTGPSGSATSASRR